jgi:hypothetical protein
MMHMACLVIFLSCQLVEIVPTRSWTTPNLVLSNMYPCI